MAAQRVRVPWRLVTSPAYGDAAVAVYVKIAALAARPEGCEAGVSYLAGLLGMSISTVERALKSLSRPAPDDDVVELTTTRRTYRGGRGQTAVRRVRRPAAAEAWAWVPTRAPEGLTPRQLRAYAALSYSTDRGLPVSYAELGQVLRHRTGRRAGQPLEAAAVARIVRDLARLGWITVQLRAGHQGRHQYDVHAEPVQPPLPAPTPNPAPGPPASDDGSGTDLGAGSLATEEDPTPDSPDAATAAVPIRRRRDTGSRAVDNPAPPVDHGGPGPARAPYGGPQLTLSPRIWRVLEPVRPLLPGLSPYVLRALARAIGAQLDTGTAPERLAARLRHRYATTEPPRDPGRWLLGAAIVRRGCGLDVCESGRIWHTGTPCQVCADLRASRPPGGPSGPRRPPWPPPPAPGPPRTWCPCPDCTPPALRRTDATRL
ncbi:hypothetical protein ABZ714_19600 [Streptomyces sp. NPDC006798]|uniref:hypothetical protein n=1 Tax=Streptomyces sp. NPDC006798 TaxID=3155462 RepID=UPI003411E912